MRPKPQTIVVTRERNIKSNGCLKIKVIVSCCLLSKFTVQRAFHATGNIFLNCSLHRIWKRKHSSKKRKCTGLTCSTKVPSEEDSGVLFAPEWSPDVGSSVPTCLSIVNFYKILGLSFRSVISLLWSIFVQFCFCYNSPFTNLDHIQQKSMSLLYSVVDYIIVSILSCFSSCPDYRPIYTRSGYVVKHGMVVCIAISWPVLV